LVPSKAIEIPTSVSPDGNRLAYTQFDLAAGRTGQIFTLQLEHKDGGWKAGKPEQFLSSTFNDVGARFSPDGKWLAYSSTESGTMEVYVRPFPLPANGGKWTISTSGGGSPAWSRASHDLLYQAGGTIMAVSYTVKDGVFKAEKPRVWAQGIAG